MLLSRVAQELFNVVDALRQRDVSRRSLLKDLNVFGMLAMGRLEDLHILPVLLSRVAEHFLEEIEALGHCGMAPMS
eukprot:CAMPEP_0180799472 /NCGR_PEP_ID=MMETSP1038_2-20121128/58556_1 /TAXON_ID=632150 /ORGANISM="Azadinium spinosum, Strain 3D9" /LENGTH=75 /DNA_ID=CAMNT_0022839071 /DNA_START=21 /DNA_END=248 /DNA_ORIENTATION=-